MTLSESCIPRFTKATYSSEKLWENCIQRCWQVPKATYSFGRHAESCILKAVPVVRSHYSARTVRTAVPSFVELARKPTITATVAFKAA